MRTKFDAGAAVFANDRFLGFVIKKNGICDTRTFTSPASNAFVRIKNDSSPGPGYERPGRACFHTSDLLNAPEAYRGEKTTFNAAGSPYFYSTFGYRMVFLVDR